jgi:hypothetical protein
VNAFSEDIPEQCLHRPCTGNPVGRPSIATNGVLRDVRSWYAPIPAGFSFVPMRVYSIQLLDYAQHMYGFACAGKQRVPTGTRTFGIRRRNSLSNAC